MMDESNLFYYTFEQKFTSWAIGNDEIRAAFIIGSRARSDHPADVWSDMDIVIYAQNPQHYLMNGNWIKSFGNVISSFVFMTAGNDPERLTLFEGGWQVDFIHPIENLLNMVTTKTIPNNFYRGVKVIIDKDNISDSILPNEFTVTDHMAMTEEQFTTNVQMFWFVAMYVAKQILRNELWIVKTRDNDLKALLLQMIEWHERIINGNGHDTWHAGRFIYEWANPETYKELFKAFGHFDRTDSWNALRTSISLFKALSHEVSKHTGIANQVELEDYVYSWIASHTNSVITTEHNTI